MGKTGKYWLMGGVIVIILGICLGIYEHVKPLTEKQFKALPIEKQFKKAPQGHYIHLRKEDPNLYRTTWSKKHIHDEILKFGRINKPNGDGTINFKTKLGTQYLFNDNILVDKEDGSGILGLTYEHIIYNDKFSSDLKYDTKAKKAKYDYNWYFTSPQAAQKDKYVKQSVTSITR